MYNELIVKELEKYPPLLDVNHIREILQVGRCSVYDFLKQNKVKVIEVGKQKRVVKSSLIEYLAANT